MQKKYIVKELPGYTYIEFYGDIDDTVCPKYKKEISDLINEKKNSNVVFDFKEVTFIDSSGIGLILGRYNQLKETKRKLYVNKTNNQIKKLFKISGIYTIISEFDKEMVGEK